jgi:FAD/FMN-containing dehydrogenase
LSSSSTPIAQLRSSFVGRVTGPGDAGYDQARKVFYGKWDRRPAAVVRPTSAQEVARVVTLAAESGSELAVRSGGHSLAGHSVSDGGIVLDLAELTALDIDLDSGTAWAQTGLTAAAYTAQVGEHGLATGFGDTGSVGIGGSPWAAGSGSWSASTG